MTIDQTSSTLPTVDERQPNKGMTVREAAAKLGATEQAIYRLHSVGKIALVKQGGRWIVPTDVYEILKARWTC